MKSRLLQKLNGVDLASWAGSGRGPKVFGADKRMGCTQPCFLAAAPKCNVIQNYPDYVSTHTSLLGVVKLGPGAATSGPSLLA